MKPRFFALLGALAFAAACNSPKYAPYESVFKDFTVSAPWGWSVVTDEEKDVFAQTNFIAPFDPDFYLGAPSLSVRWFKNYRPHRLRDGRLEMYANADDFIGQTMRQVYGEASSVLYVAGPNGGLAIAEKPQDITLKGSGLPAKFFVVLSPTPAPENNQWGVEQEKATGKTVNMRKHAYVVVPMEGGFYVLCYPATRRGYARFEDRFRALFGSFRPLTAGPNGPKVMLRAPAS